LRCTKKHWAWRKPALILSGDVNAPIVSGL
jgi:hypothetical protein